MNLAVLPARHAGYRSGHTAVVIGAPSDKWGETPVAAVILARPGAASGEEIRSCVNARVEARYQQLHDVTIVDDFPRSAAGKTLKRVLRDRYGPGR
ncbi:MAG: AMP-binding enzyme [Gemmatimonadota bacterium]